MRQQNQAFRVLTHSNGVVRHVDFGESDNAWTAFAAALKAYTLGPHVRTLRAPQR